MRAVVTGAARGIGAAISDRLGDLGYDVVKLDLEAAHDVLACDVRDPDAVESVARAAGEVDVLVNNAGIWRFAPLEEVSPGDFLDVLSVNVLGALHCTQSFGRAMLARGSGSIVNIVSIAAHAASPGVGAYSSSKSALLALTRQTALEWGGRGVRCNAVGPGFIVTPGTAFYAGSEIAARRAAAVPLLRLGTPRDVADVVAFLASEQAAYVNAQVLYVDGGVSQSVMAQMPRIPEVRLGDDEGA